mgnify:CR=1 FL=1
MPVAPLTEKELSEERKREKEEREWYANENRLIREHNLELAKINARTERERIKDQKRYIHAITILKLFKRKIPKIFLKHLN